MPPPDHAPAPAAGRNRLYWWLLTLFFVVLALPTLVHLWPELDNANGLGGAYLTTARPELSWAAWQQGTFQEQHSRWVEENIGARPTLVRLRNQLRFSAFDAGNTNTLLVGVDKTLFMTDYVAALKGEDFMGERTLRARLARLRAVQELLRRQGRLLLLVLAPSKARFWPERLPARCRPTERRRSNYEAYVEQIRERGITAIDFNAWFGRQKDKAAYPLYPPGGIHWSQYGATLAADSLARFLRGRGFPTIPPVRWQDVRLATQPESYDGDIEWMMNLWWPLNDVRLAYPTVTVAARPDSATRPGLLTVGDSYYWNWARTGLFSHLFRQPEFWFYDHEVYKNDATTPTSVPADSLLATLKRTPIIVVLATEINLPKAPWLVVDRLYDAYHAELAAAGLLTPELLAEERFRRYQQLVQSQPAYWQQLAATAQQRGLPVEEVVREAMRANWP